MIPTLYGSRKIVFGIGFLIGIGLAFLFRKSENELSFDSCHRTRNLKQNPYINWISLRNVIRKPLDFEDLIRNPTILTEARYLQDKISVLCVVFVRKVNNAKAIKDTWGKHCNELMFFGLFENDTLPIIQIQPESSWHFLCESIRHLWNNHSHELQWVLFLNDDMFAILENLRYYVTSFDYHEPHYLGHALAFWNQLYNIGQAGYVLSKGALHALQTKFNSTKSCQESGKYWKNEDFYLGKHLGSLGIIPEDTRDAGGRGRFHGYNFNLLLFPGRVSTLGNYYRKSIYPIPEGPECCSERSITFHGTEADKIYQYYYVLYRLKRFGRSKSGSGPARPSPVPLDEVWREVVRAEGLGEADISPQQYYRLWESKLSSPERFNEALRRQQSGDGAAAFANMPDVLQDMLGSWQGGNRPATSTGTEPNAA